MAEKVALEEFAGAGLGDQLNYALMTAVMRRSARMVALLLSAGADPHSAIQPLLVTAVDFNAPSVVNMLLKHGFSVNAEGSHGTALHSAVRMGNLKVAETLAEAGAELNASDHSLTTPLHLAVQTKNADCVEWLLSRGCHVNPVDATWGRTPLHWAALFQKTDILELLIAYGADLMAIDKNNCAPWTLAVTNKNKETLKVLFAKHDVNVNDKKGKTPLHWVCRCGFSAGMELLISLGANINAQDTEGITPLMDSMAMRQGQMAETLIDWPDTRLDLDATDHNGKTSLHWACRTGLQQCVWLLITRGANCNVMDSDGLTPFLEAVAIRHGDVVAMLIQSSNMNVSRKDRTGRIPLHWVCRTGLEHCARFLIKTGTNVNAQDIEGRTPLMDAVLSREHNTVVALLESPLVYVNAICHAGQSALHLALSDGPHVDHVMLQLLVSGGADLNQRLPNTNCTPIMFYIGKWPAVAQWLLSVGADPNLITDSGDTALLKAAESGSIDIVKMILRANIDLDISAVKGPKGVSPVVEACLHEDTNIYKLLVNAGCSLTGVARFVEDVAGYREDPRFDRELTWLETQLKTPKTLREASRRVINNRLGHINYRSKIQTLLLPRMLKDFLALDGFLLWKERHDGFDQ